MAGAAGTVGRGLCFAGDSVPGGQEQGVHSDASACEDRSSGCEVGWGRPSGCPGGKGALTPDLAKWCLNSTFNASSWAVFLISLSHSFLILPPFLPSSLSFKKLG